MIYEDGIKVIVADASHEKYVDLIIDTIREAARKRGTGIAERTHEYVATKMKEGKAVLALDPTTPSELGDKFVGFSYIETWGNKSYVTTSGLIVHPDYQGRNIAKRERKLSAVPTGQIELQYSRPFHHARTLRTTNVTPATMSVGRLFSHTSRV